MSKRDDLLAKFRIHGGILTTADFAADRKLSCEYRKLLCELRDRGFCIQKTKIEDNLFRYELREPQANGQFEMAL